MHTLQGIESVLKVVWIINHQNEFITRLYSCIIFVILLDIRLEASALLKTNLLIGIFQVFCAISPGSSAVKAVVFKNTSPAFPTFPVARYKK